MGKNIMPGQGNIDRRQSYSRAGLKPHNHSSPRMRDPFIILRVNQYLAENKDKVYVDINDMVNVLQRRYVEYGRRKKDAFKQIVEKAFAVVLQQCGMSQGSNLAQNNTDTVSSENSSSEVEECNVSDDNQTTTSNNQLVNLYKANQLQAMAKHYNEIPKENAELINLSSDDENQIGSEVRRDDKGDRSNGRQNHVFKDTTVTLVKGGKKVVKNPLKTEKPSVTITRKRKLGAYKLPSASSSLRKSPLITDTYLTFDNVGGNTKVLEEVCKLVFHLQHPEVYRQLGVCSPRGLLLHGPPGCGKTLLACAIAGELDIHLIKVSAPELVGGVSGESEERIRELFETALEHSPCVLFIDEIDAVTPNRQNAQREMERRIVAQLLTCMDELGNRESGDQVLVIGATNRPDALDPALRRAGRFDREVCLGIPDLTAREQILRVVCAKLKLSEDVDYDELATNTPGFVGADLVALTREAAMQAINRVFTAMQKRDTRRHKAKRQKLDESNEGPQKLETEKPDDEEVSVFQTDEVISDENIDVDVLDKDEGKPEKEASSITEANAEDKACAEDKADEKIEVDVVEDEKKDVEEGAKEKVDAEEEGEKEVEENKEETDNKKKEDKQDKTDKPDSDMEIADTGSEESAGKAASEDESEVEILMDAGSPSECSPPTLEMLLTWLRDSPPLSQQQLQRVRITRNDFTKALKSVQPSAKREGFATVPDVTWDDIGSLTDVREELKMFILGPVKYRKQFEQLGLIAPTGILLCGPPGCGKTLLAKAVANEAGINFISVKGPELLNMYVGESERAVRQCFQRARNSAPCVIFFDELDALCPKRSDSGENGAGMRVVNQMLTEMDGVEERKEVFLMAATNRPDIIDPAVLRPGRLDKIVYVGLPSATDRVDILKALTKNGTQPPMKEGTELEQVATDTRCEGYTGADLAALTREAALQALREMLAEDAAPDTSVAVTQSHFSKALDLIRPSISTQDKKRYEELRRMYTNVSSLH